MAIDSTKRLQCFLQVDENGQYMMHLFAAINPNRKLQISTPEYSSEDTRWIVKMQEVECSPEEWQPTRYVVRPILPQSDGQYFNLEFLGVVLSGVEGSGSNIELLVSKEDAYMYVSDGTYGEIHWKLYYDGDRNSWDLYVYANLPLNCEVYSNSITQVDNGWISRWDTRHNNSGTLVSTYLGKHKLNQKSLVDVVIEIYENGEKKKQGTIRQSSPNEHDPI